MNKNKLQSLARDLRKTPPRSPRETLGGFVIAARMLDKARADMSTMSKKASFRFRKVPTQKNAESWIDETERTLGFYWR
jgi:hypothetical protein